MGVTMEFRIRPADVGKADPEVLGAWPGEPTVLKNFDFHSMQEVAGHTGAWSVYSALSPVQKTVFRECLDDTFVFSMRSVRGMAQARVAPPPPAMPLNVPHPDTIVGSTNDAHLFKTWLFNQSQRMQGFETYLKFVPGAAYTLKDGTVSVPLHIAREGGAVPYTGFVFHFHPGAKGADVNSPHASTGHFKPNDGVKIRVKRYEVTENKILRDLWKECRKRAK